MASLRSCLLAFAAAVALASAATPPAQTWKVPPLDGELHGELAPAMLNGRVAYLEGQTYLEPHPRELMLRNHV